MITRRYLASATISAVKIRAVTLGLDLPAPELVDAPLVAAGRFLREARQAFGAAGVEVQTTRATGADLRRFPADLAEWSARTEKVARANGIEYLSLGRLPASAASFVADRVAPILAAGETIFVSADLIDGRLPSVGMAAACAAMVKQLANATHQGFGNL